MGELVALWAPPALVLLLCFLPAVGTARTLLGAGHRRGLPLVRDRLQVVEATGTAVAVTCVATVAVPWGRVPVAVWGLVVAATAVVAVGGAVAAPSLPRLVPDSRGRLRPGARVASAAVAALVALVLVVAVA